MLTSLGPSLLVAFLAAAGAAPAVSVQPVDPDALAMKEFADRVQEYAELQRRLSAALPRLEPTSEPAQILAHRRALANAIRSARATAKPGDIFNQRARSRFRSIIRADLKQRDLRDAYAAIQQVPLTLPLRVNTEYPEGLPLSTVPPILLKRLQQLPEAIEYRFLGRHLILRDVQANLIVDYIDRALPRRP